MNDFSQEQQSIFERSPRRGVQLVKDASDLKRSISKGYDLIITKPVKVGSLGHFYLFMMRPEKPEDEYLPNGEGLAFNADGNLIRGNSIDLVNKGYYNVFVFGDSPEEISEKHQYSVSIWVGNGPSVSDNFGLADSHESGKEGLIATFKKVTEHEGVMKEGPDLFIPNDINIFKQIRISVSNMTGGESGG
jgi:hypothetical protein